MEGKEWTVKKLIEALQRFPLGAKVYYEMGPNGAGVIGKAQYVRVRRSGSYHTGYCRAYAGIDSDGQRTNCCADSSK